jgi:ribosomal protein L37AE/L43A
MRKPYPPSERCPECQRMVGGTASNPGNWYCEVCKMMFGEMADRKPYKFENPPYNLIRPGSV